MARNANLPFPRGSTYREFASSVAAADVAGVLHLIGKEYVVEDKIHGCGEVTLKVVQVATAGPAAVLWTGGATFSFATPLSYNWKAYPTNAVAWTVVGKSVAANAGAASAGDPICMLDDYYAWSGKVGTIAQNDLAYAIVKGPCKALTTGTISNFDGGDEFTSQATGTLAKSVLEAAAVGVSVVGRVLGTFGADAAETVDSKSFVTLWIGEGAIAHGGS